MFTVCVSAYISQLFPIQAKSWSGGGRVISLARSLWWQSVPNCQSKWSRPYLHFDCYFSKAGEIKYFWKFLDQDKVSDVRLLVSSRLLLLSSFQCCCSLQFEGNNEGNSCHSESEERFMKQGWSLKQRAQPAASVLNILCWQWDLKG